MTAAERAVQILPVVGRVLCSEGEGGGAAGMPFKAVVLFGHSVATYSPQPV